MKVTMNRSGRLRVRISDEVRTGDCIPFSINVYLDEATRLIYKYCEVSGASISEGRAPIERLKDEQLEFRMMEVSKDLAFHYGIQVDAEELMALADLEPSL